MTDVLAEAKAEIAITDGASVTAELGRDISVDVNVVDGAQVTVELTAGPELDVDLGAGGAVEVDLEGSAELYFLPDGELDGYYTKSEADERLAGKSDTDHTHDGRYYTRAEEAALLALKSDEGHTHDERYYTEAETDALLAGKSGTNHNHDSRYYTETETDALLAGKSNTGHTHDDRYYTEAEIDTLLAALVPTYAPGDTYSISASSGSAPLPGFCSASKTEVTFSVVVPKSLANITGVTVTALVGGIRTTSGGYLDGSNNTKNWLSGYTVTTSITADNIVLVVIRKSSAFSTVTNNTPVTVSPSSLVLSFT